MRKTRFPRREQGPSYPTGMTHKEGVFTHWMRHKQPRNNLAEHGRWTQLRGNAPSRGGGEQIDHIGYEIAPKPHQKTRTPKVYLRKKISNRIKCQCHLRNRIKRRLNNEKLLTKSTEQRVNKRKSDMPTTIFSHT